MLTVDMILKRAMKGELDLIGPAMAVAKELTDIPDFSASTDESFFAAEKKALRNLKKAGLMIAGAAVQKFMQKLGDEQEILMNLADMMIEGYVAESTLLRTEKLVSMRGEDACKEQIDMARLYLDHAVAICQKSGREAIVSFTEGDEQRMMLMGLKRFTKMEPFNVRDARRRVADYVISKKEYSF